MVPKFPGLPRQERLVILPIFDPDSLEIMTDGLFAPIIDPFEPLNFLFHQFFQGRIS